MIQILQVQLLNIFSKLKDLFSPILVFDGVDKKHPNLVRELNSRLENLFWIMPQKGNSCSKVQNLLKNNSKGSQIYLERSIYMVFLLSLAKI